MVFELSSFSSIGNHFLAEIRDVTIQRDPMRFRKNLERIAALLGYELSKTLAYETQNVQTPLGEATLPLLKQQPVIASVLRAGLTMHNGLLDVFDRAENAFISAYREKTADHSVQVKVEYKASPDLEGKTLIIADPMLATGKSLQLTYDTLLQNGTPDQLHIVSAIASREAIQFLESYLPENTQIWVGTVDPELNDKAYIIPGLGDAGDLAYGLKI